MEKRNKQAYLQFIEENGGKNRQKQTVNWEDTEKGKNYNLLIPAPILEMDLSFNSKIVLGLIYTSVKKIGEMKMTNKRIAKYLCLSENTVSTTMNNLKELTLIEKRDKGYILSDEVVETIESRKERAILLPFEISHSKLPAAAKILWGEYNSLSKGVKPYNKTNVLISKRLNIGKSTITVFTKRLYQADFLTKYEVFSDYEFKERIVITKIFKRSKKDDYNKNTEE